LELRSIAPQVAGAVQLLRQRLETSTRFVAAVPHGASHRVRSYFDKDVVVVEGRAQELLMACDAAIVKSGTSTLEQRSRVRRKWWFMTRRVLYAGNGS
jgi:lipid A disaccharide synthetase